MNDLKNPYGIVNGELKHIKDIDKGEEILCPCCNEKLIVKQGGIIRKHLAHYSSESCGGESQIHRLTKQYIYENIKELEVEKNELIVTSNGTDVKLQISDEKKLLGVKQKYLEYRGYDGKYIPDILLQVEGNIFIAIEIHYKNKKDIYHLKECLEDIPIAQVYEITVTNSDIEDMDLNSMLRKKELIYNEIEDQYKAFNEYRKKESDKINLELRSNREKMGELQDQKTELKLKNIYLSRKLSSYEETDLDSCIKEVVKRDREIAMLKEEDKKSYKIIEKLRIQNIDLMVELRKYKDSNESQISWA